MALTGLDIYKLLPKTNCKKCGSPTCLAFAMKLAMKKASLDECPYVSKEARLALEQASRPPIATITLSGKKDKIEIGGETVLFRHEKTFYHQTAIAISVDDRLNKKEAESRIKVIEEISFERVGQHISIDAIALLNNSLSGEKFLETLEEILSVSGKPLVLVSNNPDTIESALKKILGGNGVSPLIYPLDASNIEDMCKIARAYNVPLALKAPDLDSLDRLSQRAIEYGVEKLVLSPSSKSLNEMLNDFTMIRRAALKKNYRPFGYPIVAVLTDSDRYRLVGEACIAIAKYASLIILDTLDKEVLLPLITLRQNIYTDPQRPVTVEPRLYKFGAVDKNSPVLVTTNFSLTYFTVAPEIEASKIPSYLLVTDSEGMSVLTAWAAEKFTAEIISDTMKRFNVEEMVSHKNIIIPGYVAILSGKLEDISGWKVLVGPKEATGIPKYLKEIWR